MKKLFRVTRFFRLTDEQDNLSITNIAVICALIKLASVKVTGMEDFAIGAVALMNYAHKKHIGKK